MIKELWTKRKVKKEQEAKYRLNLDMGAKVWGMTTDEYKYESSSFLANIAHRVDILDKIADLEEQKVRADYEIERQRIFFPDVDIEATEENIREKRRANSK